MMNNTINLKTEIEPHQRWSLAKHMALAVEGQDCKETPYPISGDRTDYWTVDRGNDWKIKFFDDDLKKIEIIHRYWDGQAVEALTAWLAYRFLGEVL